MLAELMERCEPLPASVPKVEEKKEETKAVAPGQSGEKEKKIPK